MAPFNCIVHNLNLVKFIILCLKLARYKMGTETSQVHLLRSYRKEKSIFRERPR